MTAHTCMTMKCRACGGWRSRRSYGIITPWTIMQASWHPHPPGRPSHNPSGLKTQVCAVHLLGSHTIVPGDRRAPGRGRCAPVGAGCGLATTGQPPPPPLCPMPAPRLGVSLAAGPRRVAKVRAPAAAPPSPSRPKARIDQSWRRPRSPVESFDPLHVWQSRTG